MDNWIHRSENMSCGKCMWYVQKPRQSSGSNVSEDGVFLGRCRKHSPTMSGWPAIYATDWCGDHKLDENKI